MYIGGFVIESIRVEHVGVAAGRYEYPIEIVVRGKGGKEGARKALKPFLDTRTTLFSEFGNPYQCSMGSIEVAKLEPERYRVSARGVGVRVHLRTELVRFLGWLADAGHAPDLAGPDAQVRERVAAQYLVRYQAEAAARRPPAVN